MAIQKSTTQSGLMTLNPSLKTKEKSFRAPIFNYEAAEERGERDAQSPQSRARVSRVLERMKNRRL